MDDYWYSMNMRLDKDILTDKSDWDLQRVYAVDDRSSCECPRREKVCYRRTRQLAVDVTDDETHKYNTLLIPSQV